MPYGNDRLDCFWSQAAEALQCPPRRFHTPIRSLPHSRERASIGSPLTFEGHISQSCGADIRSVYSFLTGTRRLILSAATWGIHPSACMGIDAFIGHPSRNGKMPVYRAPCISSPIHRDTATSMTRGPSAKPPHPAFFGIAKRRTLSRYQSEGREERGVERCGSSLLDLKFKKVSGSSIGCHKLVAAWVIASVSWTRSKRKD